MPNSKSKAASSRSEIFSIWNEELQGRIDAFFYRPYFKILTKAIESKKYKRLDELVEFSSEVWNQHDGFTDVFPYIEISAIDTFVGEIKDVEFVPIAEAPSRAKMLVRNEDIIVSTTRPSRGAIAKIAMEQDGYIASTGFVVLRKIKDAEILKDYLLIALRSSLSLQQMEQRSTGGNYPAITTEDLKEIKIVLPTRSEQQKIVTYFQKAYAEKKEKEEQIKSLLASIDGYVLGELGIELPPPAKITAKTFIIWSDEISTRLDPLYLRNFVTLRNLKPKYDMVTLESLLSVPPQYGANESAIEGTPVQDIRYIRITDVDENGDLKEESWKTAARIQDKYLLQENDLLFARSGATAGKSFIYKTSFGKSIFAGYMIRFKIDEKKANADYIFSFTKTMWYDLWVKTIQRPSGQPNINSEEYKSLQLPLPPLPVQNKIAKEVSKRRAEADALKRNAVESLHKAQEEVEQMILA